MPRGGEARRPARVRRQLPQGQRATEREGAGVGSEREADWQSIPFVETLCNYLNSLE